MISAKDEFFLEREMLNELQQMIYEADLSPEQQSIIYEKFDSELTISDFENIKKEILQNKIHPLTKIKNGETLLQKQINKAVQKAADTE